MKERKNKAKGKAGWDRKVGIEIRFSFFFVSSNNDHVLLVAMLGKAGGVSAAAARASDELADRPLDLSWRPPSAPPAQAAPVVVIIIIVVVVVVGSSSGGAPANEGEYAGTHAASIAGRRASVSV
jgi:hypothetical protein